MEMMIYVWLGVTILAAIVEAIVPSLVSIWFVPGGLAALIVSICHGELWLQILVFLAVSALALVITRPLARKAQRGKPEKTNADMALGRTAVVTEEIDNVLGAGRATVLGNSWSARSEEPEGKIPAGTVCRVKRIEGVKLILAPEEEKGDNVL